MSFDKERLQSSKHIGTLCSSSLRCLVQPWCMGSMSLFLWTLALWRRHCPITNTAFWLVLVNRTTCV